MLCKQRMFTRDMSELNASTVRRRHRFQQGAGLTLHTNPDRAVAHVGATGLGDRVVVDVDMVEVEGHDLGEHRHRS